MTFTPGEPVHYRTLHGEVYRATVVKVRPSPLGDADTLDLDIEVPYGRGPGRFVTERVPAARCRPIAAYGPPFTTDVP